VFPKSEVIGAFSRNWPVKLAVRVNFSNGDVLWEGSQKELYRKYPDRQAKAQNEIEAAVRKLVQ